MNSKIHSEIGFTDKETWLTSKLDIERLSYDQLYRK